MCGWGSLIGVLFSPLPCTRLLTSQVALLLWKHPGETAEHKQKLRKLVEEWNRHIFGKTKDFKQVPFPLLSLFSLFMGGVGGVALALNPHARSAR